MARKHPSPSASIAPQAARAHARDARGGRPVGPASLKRGLSLGKILPRQRVATRFGCFFCPDSSHKVQLYDLSTVVAAQTTEFSARRARHKATTKRATYAT